MTRISDCMDISNPINTLKKSLNIYVKLLDWKNKELVREKVDYDISECIFHFRIGDYKNIQNAHPLMPLKYYDRAIYNIIAETGKDEWKVLYFYEQDVNDVNGNSIIKNKYPKMEFVSVDHGLVDYKQMLLMSMCSTI